MDYGHVSFGPQFAEGLSVLVVELAGCRVPDAQCVLTSGRIDLPVKESVQSPSLSPDGRILYFSSDMPGGQGGWDLWQVRRLPKQKTTGAP
jgi:hypothetical protein